MAVKPFSKFFLIGFSTICLFAFICFLRLQSSRESDRALSLKKKDSFDADIIAYKKKKRFNSLSINTSTISSANSGSFWADIHDKINLEVLDAIIKKHSEYKNRKPFPHLVEDNMFPDSVLYTAAAEIPDSPSLKKAGCISSSSKCFDEDTQKFKNAFDSDYHFGPATATLFSLLKSSMFIKFLEKLTGTTITTTTTITITTTTTTAAATTTTITTIITTTTTTSTTTTSTKLLYLSILHVNV